jgi:hypothetical protein
MIDCDLTLDGGTSTRVLPPCAYSYRTFEWYTAIGSIKRIIYQHSIQRDPSPCRANSELCGIGGLPRGSDRSLHIARLGLAAFPQQLSLPFSGFVQTDGSKPKSDSGERQYDSEARNDGLVVVVKLDPFKPSLAEQKRSSKEGGAVMLFVVVGGWLYQARS